MKSIDITDLDPQKKFDVKLHVSLINYAERIIPAYKEKQDEIREYISDQVSKIKVALNIKSERFEILENNKVIFKK
jgi:hypothetical protein